MKYVFLVCLLLLSAFAYSDGSVSTQTLMASKTTNSFYDLCTTELNTNTDECRALGAKLSSISDIVNFIYVDEVDDLEYLSCVKDQVGSNQLNYLSVRDTCYGKIYESSKLRNLNSMFNVHCYYDLNSTNSNLSVNCRALFLSTCFYYDIDMTRDGNNYNITPIVKRNELSCQNSARVSFKRADFELGSILPSQIKINDETFASKDGNKVDLKDLYTGSNIKDAASKLSSVEKAYYSCLALYVLHYRYNDTGIDLTPTRFMPDAELINDCKNKVTLKYSVYVDRATDEKRLLKSNMQNQIKSFLSSNTIDNVDTFIDSILLSYERYDSLYKKLESSYNNSLTYNFNLEILFSRLNRALIGSSSAESSEIKNGFKVTLVKDMDDKIQVKRINDVKEIINFFEDQKAILSNTELKSLIDPVRDEVVVDFITRNGDVNLAYVDFSLSPNTLILPGVSLQLKPATNINTDSNLTFIVYPDNVTFSFGDVNISTKLNLTYTASNLYVGDRQLTNLPVSDSRLTSQDDLKAVLVEDQDKFLVYALDRAYRGYFLGLFPVKLSVKEKYNASNGVLFSVEKPWWDFFIIFNSGILK